METLLLINEFFNYLKNKIILLEELSQEDKKKLKKTCEAIASEWRKWRNTDKVGTVEGKEDDAKKLIKDLMEKAAKLRPSMEKLKLLTKEGMTDTEKIDLETWDYCEKMLTELQNKMAKGNDELKKHNNNIYSSKGKRMVPNPDWRQSCLNSVKTKYFNY
jgi:CRISPR/Cas system-associated endonuclease/helicase Cas3